MLCSAEIVPWRFNPGSQLVPCLSRFSFADNPVNFSGDVNFHVNGGLDKVAGKCTILGISCSAVVDHHVGETVCDLRSDHLFLIAQNLVLDCGKT